MDIYRDKKKLCLLQQAKRTGKGNNISGVYRSQHSFSLVIRYNNDIIYTKLTSIIIIHTVNFCAPLQISFSSGSPALSDRTRFRKYFRNSPTSEIVAPTLRSVAAQFNWTRVAVITQEEALFTIVSIYIIIIILVSCFVQSGQNSFAINIILL